LLEYVKYVIACSLSLATSLGQRLAYLSLPNHLFSPSISCAAVLTCISDDHEVARVLVEEFIVRENLDLLSLVSHLTCEQRTNGSTELLSRVSLMKKSSCDSDSFLIKERSRV